MLQKVLHLNIYLYICRTYLTNFALIFLDLPMKSFQTECDKLFALLNCNIWCSYKSSIFYTFSIPGFKINIIIQSFIFYGPKKEAKFINIGLNLKWYLQKHLFVSLKNFTNLNEHFYILYTLFLVAKHFI